MWSEELNKNPLKFDPIHDQIKQLPKEDRFNVRLVSKSLADKDKGIPQFIYDNYHPYNHKKNKYLAKECILLDCVYQGKKEEAKWLLENTTNLKMLIFLTSCYNQSYVQLTARSVAKAKGFQEIADLFDKQSNDSYADIDLCMAACAGNITEFEQSLLKAKEGKKNTVFLWLYGQQQ